MTRNNYSIKRGSNICKSSNHQRISRARFWNKNQGFGTKEIWAFIYWL